MRSAVTCISILQAFEKRLLFSRGEEERGGKGLCGAERGKW